MQAVTNNPLLVREDVSANSNQSICGTILKRRFTVFNLGKQRAEISVSVTATNEKSESAQNWCSLEPNPVVLDSGDSQEVALIFDIPQQAIPDIYNYEVLFEAPEQYPESFFRCVQELIVSGVEQEPEWGEAPQFDISPVSTSSKPYCIQPEEKLTIAVKVRNRSHLVDAFELSCPDLEPEWYTVSYPERDLELPGLITNTEGLKLNPGKEGKIGLTIHPPSLTLAGDYVRTIQLASRNRSSLILLDALYLRISSDDRLAGEISPELRTLPKETGKFEIEVANLGNLIRDLDLQVEDGTGMFAYNLETRQLRLLPGETNNLSLIAKPRWFMGWRRPLRGDGLRARFNIVADNSYDVVLPETKKPPAIPRSLSSGTLILSPRPRWQLIALITLAISAVGGLLFAIYWWVFRLPPAPRIRNFDAVKTEREDRQDAVLLNWRIKNPQQLDKIGIISEGSDGEQDETFNSFGSCTRDSIADCIPQELSRFCQVDGKDIKCSRVPVNVANSGKYTFELQLFPERAEKLLRKRDPSEAIARETSDSLTVNPAPVPEFSQNPGLVASKPVYKIPSSESIELRWEITQYSKLKKLNILGNSGNNKVDAYSYIFLEKTGNLVPVNPQQRQDSLRCSRTGKDVQTCSWQIPANIVEAGDYNFAVEAFAALDAKQPSDTIEVENTVTVEALPLPEIEQFATDKSTIQEGEPIALSWQIENPQQIENIAVRAITNGGSSTLLNQYDYPSQVKEFCPTKIKNNLLRCSSVSSVSLLPGSYRFQLSIEPQLKQSEKITEQTDTIKVQPKPQPFAIEYLTINGDRVGNSETYLYPSQQNTPTKVDIGWSIIGSPNVKIELLPLGEQTELAGNVPYYIEGDRERITLKVTNELGEQQTQTVQIQPYKSNSPRQTSENKSSSTKSPDRPNVPEIPNTAEDELPTTDSGVIPPPPTQFEPDNSGERTPIKLNPLEVSPKAN